MYRTSTRKGNIYHVFKQSVLTSRQLDEERVMQIHTNTEASRKPERRDWTDIPY